MERDVYRIACDIVGGYERRKKKYLEDLEEARTPKLTADYTKQQTMGGECQSSIELSGDRVFAVEESLNTKFVHAVDQAKSCLILKYGDREAEKIFKALKFNMLDKWRYSYLLLERTMNLFVSRRTFYRIKEEFLDTIADYIQLK